MVIISDQVLATINLDLRAKMVLCFPGHSLIDFYWDVLFWCCNRWS